MRAFGMVLVTLGGLLLLPGLCFLAFRSLWGPDPGYFITGIALVAVAAGFLLRFFGNRD
jgi:hypothetical protein